MKFQIENDDNLISRRLMKWTLNFPCLLTENYLITDVLWRQVIRRQSACS